MKKKKPFCFNWQIVGYAGGIVALIAALYALDDRYAKGHDVAQLEIKVVQTLEKFQDKMDYKAARDRQQYLEDEERKLKSQQRAAPASMRNAIEDDLKKNMKQQQLNEERIKELEKKK